MYPITPTFMFPAMKNAASAKKSQKIFSEIEKDGKSTVSKLQNQTNLHILFRMLVRRFLRQERRFLRHWPKQQKKSYVCLLAHCALLGWRFAELEVFVIVMKLLQQSRLETIGTVMA